jgi:hypothetical protein
VSPGCTRGEGPVGRAGGKQTRKGLRGISKVRDRVGGDLDGILLPGSQVDGGLMVNVVPEMETWLGRVIGISAPPERFFRVMPPEPVRAMDLLKIATRSEATGMPTELSAGSTDTMVGGSLETET